MKIIILGFDDNLELKSFDTIKKAFNNSCIFCLEYIEDVLEKSIERRYEFNLIDAHKNAFYINNGWVLKSFKAYNYFGRVKILMSICDPSGFNVELSSAGYSENNFVLNVETELYFLVQNYKVISYFISNKARNNYLEITQDFHFIKKYGDVNET